MCVLIENYKRIEKIDIKEKYNLLIKDSRFDELTRINTTDTKTVKERIAKVKEYFVG